MLLISQQAENYLFQKEMELVKYPPLDFISLVQ